MSTLAVPRGAPDRRETARWGVSFALVLGLHVAAGSVLLASRMPTVEPGEALPAIMVDLAPPPSAPTAVPSVSPPSENVPEMTAPKPVADAPPEMPAPEVTPPAPVAAQDPPPVVREGAAVALPPPPPKVVPRPKPVEKAVERKPPKPVQARRGEQEDPVRPPAQDAGARTIAALASTSSGSSAASRASWQGALVAHLRQNLRPQGGQTGSASVRFTMSRSGRILSTSLVGSAGSAALDAEALAVFGRSQPLPAAPIEVAGSTFTFTIPVRFTTR